MIKITFKEKNYEVVIEGEDITKIKKEYLQMKKELDSIYDLKEGDKPFIKKIKVKETIGDKILSLKNMGDFFQHPKSITEIKSKLEESGHYYPSNALSPYLLQLIKEKKLRRFKELKDNKKVWVYVQN